MPEIALTPQTVARLRSRELFTLTVLVIAMAVATVGYLAFGASMALGAFLAGMVVAQSKVSHQAAADALPMRDAFAVLFFVSVGMMFDMREIVREHRQFNPREFRIVAAPDVIDLFLEEENQFLAQLGDFISKPIKLQAEGSFRQEQYDIVLS